MPIYMNYEGIKGDVTESGHKDWIEVNSFQWGVGRAIGSPTGRGMNREAAAPSVSEIVVTKPLDKSSNALLREALQGAGKKVTINFCKTEANKLETYLEIKLENVLISGFSESSGGDRPSESISLNFTKVEYAQLTGDVTGKLGAANRVSYDLAAAKAS